MVNFKIWSTPYIHMLACLILLSVHSESSSAANPTHLRLIDNLDRPTDGYCIDIHGTPGNLRTDLPLFAHNCKPRLTVDSAVAYESAGPIRFIDLDLCVTVAGVNSQALPGAAILLRKCGESSAFFETERLQQFVLHADGQLELVNMGLCIAVGPRSASTYSPNDRWRPLFVDDCVTAAKARSRWQFTAPAYNK